MFQAWLRELASLATRDWAETLLYSTGIVSTVSALIVYVRNSRRQRSKWLFELYQHFYEPEELKPMRKRIEKGDTKFASAEDDPNALEKLDDYLNFFEFIACLWKRRELDLGEIRDVFDYPLQRIGQDEHLSQYVGNPEYGYEGIRALLKDLGYPI